MIFHSGTKQADGVLMTSGGRVLGITAIGNDLKKALNKTYEVAASVRFEGMQLRKGIGKILWDLS